MQYLLDRPLIYFVRPVAPEDGGKQAADEAARFLSCTPISRVISSLSRQALTTAQTIAVAVGVPYAERDPALGAALPLSLLADSAKILPHPIVIVSDIVEGEPGDISTLFLTQDGQLEIRQG